MMRRVAYAAALLPLLVFALPVAAQAQTATAVAVEQYEEVLTLAYPAD